MFKAKSLTCFDTDGPAKDGASAAEHVSVLADVNRHVRRHVRPHHARAARDDHNLGVVVRSESALLLLEAFMSLASLDSVNIGM